MVTLKSIFYKFCFCLGLGTASYYTFAQVQNWVKGDDAPQASVFQDKVHDLIQDEKIDLVEHMARMKRLKKASFAKAEIKPLPAAVAAPDASPAALAEASPSPAEGEKKEGEENKTAENAEETQNPEAMPIAQPYMPYQMGTNQQWDRSNSESAGANPSGSSNPDYSGMGGGFYSGSPSANHGGGSGGGSSSSIGGNSVLTQDDIATLTAPVQATFTNQQNQVNGYVCSSASSCSHQSGLSVHSLRWNAEEGLRPDVNFTVKAASGSAPVQFDVNFKIQDRFFKDQTVTMTARPNEVLVHNETRDSKSYRVYEFRMPDTEVRSEDTLSQMQATLVYEVTETGMVMSPESKFSFARDQVKTSSDNWDPNASGEVAQNELYFVADELPYSMSLQKSP